MSGADTVADRPVAAQAKSEGRGPRVQLGLAGIVLLGVALAPLNTKVAGAAWLALCVLGLTVGLRGARPANASSPGMAATAWLLGCLVAMAAWTTLSWLWNEPCCAASADLSSGLRLLLAAAASWLMRRGLSLPMGRRPLNIALTVACLVSLVLTLLVENRLQLPSNPIPWAVSISFLACILWPSALDPTESPRARVVWGLGAAAGLAAVLLSESRGAYALLLWLPLVAAGIVLGLVGKRRRKLVAAAIVFALFSVLGILASHHSDPLRLQRAWHEVDRALTVQDFNTSLGARIYVFQLAWQGFRESPWIGLGATESVRRMKTAGEHLPAADAARFELVRTVAGHAHNQYLHQAMTGGLLGLGGLLALFLGLGAAAVLLWRHDRVAGLQMAGIWVMHAAGSLSNVNLAHNYYAVMLALAVGLVLLNAGRGQSEPAVPGG